MCDFEFDLQRLKLYEQVADQIQTLIAGDELVPGERLPGERELAEGLGVCRTVVREAIRALEVRGLVQVKPGCGTFVRAYGAADAAAPVTLYLRLRGERATAEAIEIARGLAPELTAAAAARATTDDTDALKAALLSVEVNGALAQGGLDAFWAALVDASKNGLLGATLLPALGVLHRELGHGPGVLAPWLNRCGAILTPVRSREPVTAREAGRAYVTALASVLGLPLAP